MSAASLKVGAITSSGAISSTKSISASGEVSAASFSTSGAVSAGSLKVGSTGVAFSDGSKQTSAAYFTGRPAIPLSHNLIFNSMFNRLSGSVPEGWGTGKYSCSGCSMTIEAVKSPSPPALRG